MKKIDLTKELIGNRKKKLSKASEYDPMDALNYRRQGLTWKEIAKAVTPVGREKELSWVGVRAAVMRIVGPEDQHILDRNYTAESQKETIAVLLKEKHKKAIEAITPEKLAEASAKDNAMISKLLHEQLRLEDNKSTTNVAVSFAQLVENSVGEDGL